MLDLRLLRFCCFNFFIKLASTFCAVKLFVELGGSWSLAPGAGNAAAGQDQNQPWNVDNSGGGGGGYVAPPAADGGYQAPQGYGGGGGQAI